ncbi:phosphate ABC transporter membrane protein 2, PhoT family [Desulfocicer vacuolatum DSM 3385]|uniref:Phosphate ABC transporter membrane protein 2, PhoT family n=1 Tax=Desulfocicer vacuolatum DSM 3385 TaxID=1121400 RepID=A0A1W2E7K7_9BACT|nr:ABC transporter permease subunit [Desulfocicer vacuolatum]SMD05296.1 phosphate ABC transporter membrane protein 2, PhoT family [Desulfocicer vacuolatum DSM 3385]
MKNHSAVDIFLSFYAWCCAFILTSAVLTILGYLLFHGLSSLNLDLIFAHTPVMDALFLKKQVFGGLLPAITGTLALIFLSMLFALPVGIATGIFLSEFARSGTRKILGLMFDIMASLPSIVVGLFGFAVTIFLHQHFFKQLYPCLLISALCLAFLVIPYIIRSTQIALESLPPQVRLTGPALGATRTQNLWYVLIPMAAKEIIGGIILAIGRSAEDTAVIMLTGAVATAGVPNSIFSGYEALPFFIYYTAAEYANTSELMKAYGAALILLFICGGLYLFAYWIKRKVR